MIFIKMLILSFLGNLKKRIFKSFLLNLIGRTDTQTSYKCIKEFFFKQSVKKNLPREKCHKDD